jgi:AraC family transcriptional regulator
MNRTTLKAGQFYGNTRMSRNVAGFKLMEAAYTPGIKLPKHSHECACFSVMLGGAMLETYGSRTLESKPQTVAFNAANEEHRNAISSNGARFLILEIGSDLTRNIQSGSVNLSRSAVFEGGDISWLGLKLYRESVRDDEVSELAIEGLALEMMATLWRMNYRENQSPRWLVRAQEIIHARFTQSFSVSEIANTVGVHPGHLARTFRKHYGSSVADYVRKLRVDQARHDMSSTNLSLVEIALKAGFCDQGHLSRVFRRYTGMTPMKYRSLFRRVGL